MSAHKAYSVTGPLSPPVFRDVHLTDTARMTYWALLAVFVVMTVFIPVGYVFIPDAVFMLIPLFAATLLNLLMTFGITRGGHPIAAARFLVASTWVVTTAVIALTGGLESPALSGLLFIISFSAVLLGWWECVIATVTAAATVLVLVWVAPYGYSTANGLWASPMVSALLFVAICVLVAALNISSVRGLQQALSHARSSFEGLRLAGNVYDTTTQGIVVTLPDGEIVDVNEAYCAIHRCSRESVIGQNPRVLKSDQHGPEFYEEMWGTLIETGQWQGEVWDRRADDSLLPKWLSISSLKDSNGETTNYVGVFSDISAIKEGAANLEWLATHDPLTQLPNRALLDDTLEAAIARANRRGGTLAVMFMDLDRFKDVNDTLGHPAGDELLAEISGRCVESVRAGDIVARIGGDEFCVVVIDYVDSADLESVAMRFLEAIAEPVQLGEQEVYVTGSMGIATLPADGRVAPDLMMHADIAMYRAKTLGGNGFEFFSPELQTAFDHRMATASGLRRALVENRLFLLYQPQVDLVTGRITGVEALVRWRDYDGSILMPDDFIGVAEYTGLAAPLGEWVLRHALADLRVLLDAGHDLTMAVNFSARQFNEVDIATQVIDLLKVNRIAPSRLEVEITETAVLTRMDAAIAKAEALSQAGVRIAVDDFGTGYGSMSYIQLFRPDTIKIDRSFIVCLPEDAGASAIVQASMALASGIGASVVAEGTDSDDQISFLMEHGCTTAQGYWFSKPIELEPLTRMLAAGPFVLPDRVSQPM